MLGSYGLIIGANMAAPGKFSKEDHDKLHHIFDIYPMKYLLNNHLNPIV